MWTAALMNWRALRWTRTTCSDGSEVGERRSIVSAPVEANRSFLSRGTRPDDSRATVTMVRLRGGRAAWIPSGEARRGVEKSRRTEEKRRDGEKVGDQPSGKTSQLQPES